MLGLPRPQFITALRAYTFYGKVLTTAAREYFLAMRKAANLGLTSVRDIYVNLKKGGYPFETEDDNAMTGIRQVLRKNSGILHRLPNGEWGLTGWYERIKESRKAKVSTVEDDESEKAWKKALTWSPARRTPREPAFQQKRRALGPPS